MNMTECDVMVVGGGINGVGIARDAAGRGLSVFLCEKDDLGSHTSSASTKLIHGGLRYLEQFEFSLVRKALQEREVLLKSAPHIIWPLSFVMPHDRSQRPAWIIRAGLFLYDRLAVRALLHSSSSIDLHGHAAGAALKPAYVKGFKYADGWVDDARLVILNAMDAAEKGAVIATHTRFTSVVRQKNHWDVTLHTDDGEQSTVRAKNLVNATGPWAGRFVESCLGKVDERKVRLIKGSHIVVPRLFDHPFAYIFQHIDKRIIFAIPYEHDFTLIGTTDLEYVGDLECVAISPQEVDYLCSAVNRYFSTLVQPKDVRWTFAGVRPLHEDSVTNASKVTRDYHLELDRKGATLLNVFGGKLTTYRKLAEEAVNLLTGHASGEVGEIKKSSTAPWTADACLPGGDLYGRQPSSRSVFEFDAWTEALHDEYSWLPRELATRYARAYGTRARTFLRNKNNLGEMGTEILNNLYEVEVRYLVAHEWARCADDILWRRSKRGLHLPIDAAQKLDTWMELNIQAIP